MISDGFCEQSLRVCQRKDLFGKSIKCAFAQILCLRCDALDGCTTGDKPVRPLAPFSLFVVGGAVFKPLDYVLFLYKLAFVFLFLGLQLLNFFFVQDFNLLTDIKMDTKRPSTFSVDGLTHGMEFSDFAARTVCVSRRFSLQSTQG